MKISFISAIALGGALLSVAPAAYANSHHFGLPGETADCPPGTSRAGDGTCLMSSSSSTLAGGSMVYGGAAHASKTYGGSSARTYTPSYSSSSTSYTPSTSYSSSSYISRANCPAGSSRSSDGVCMVQGGSSSSSYSYSSTPLNSYRGQSSYVVDSTVTSTMSDSEADYRYGSGSISGPYTDGSNTIVPFSTTSATLTNYRVAGMGSNEFLSPTDCPVNVYNPGGGKVLGCYQVSKPAPVRVTVPSYHTVRVVRPVIYVRYPVPTPVPMAMPICGSHQWHSRYGNHWPRGGCGW